MGKDKIILVNLSGRGDKDCNEIAAILEREKEVIHRLHRFQRIEEARTMTKSFGNYREAEARNLCWT